MHDQTIQRIKHEHDFVHVSRKNRQRVWLVLWLTGITMFVEILAGLWYGSMALLADGWHMSTHLVAFGIALFAWSYAEKKKDDPHFTFSTGKVAVLASYSSAVFLVLVAVWMALESIYRLINPIEIAFDQVILVAIVGLVVNLVSAVILHKDHSIDEFSVSHGHGGHSHAHAHSGDHNHRAAYLHVLADALTSFAAIFALLAGKWLGWVWMDPAMGIVAAVIILFWAKGLLKETSSVLLDQSLPAIESRQVIDALESQNGDKVVDFHAWKVSGDDYALMVTLVSDCPQSPEAYKLKISDYVKIKHTTIEVYQCDDPLCPGNFNRENVDLASERQNHPNQTYVKEVVS